MVVKDPGVDGVFELDETAAVGASNDVKGEPAIQLGREGTGGKEAGYVLLTQVDDVFERGRPAYPASIDLRTKRCFL